MKIWQFAMWLLAVIFSCMAGYELGRSQVYERVLYCHTSVVYSTDALSCVFNEK